MSTDPTKIRGQAHAQIGRRIEEAAEALVARWHTRALAEQPSAPAVHRDTLRDHLAAFLRGLGRDLAADCSERPLLGTLQAVRHGEHRWHGGWQLSEVVRDYQLLRLVILEWLDETLERPVTLPEVMAIGLALDDAIAAAVVTYVNYHEETLQASQESLQAAKDAAEASNRAKGDFLAGVSHELRTPMNSILGLAQLALEDQLPPAAHDYLKTIHESADLILSLLNQLLDYSRLESGRLELDLHAFNLRTVLDETLRGFAAVADEKRLELACDYPVTLPEVLIGDSFRLRQVLTNLVSNAIKFTAAGEVVIHVALDTPTQQQASLRVTVADTGIGIAPEAQQSIFEPFAQAHPSTARRFGGTGLGLAICKELTARMGGRLSVESQPGQGSRFHFTVPLDLPPDEASPTLARAADPQLGGKTALVVDHHAATRQVAAQALRDWGLVVEQAEDGPGAEALLDAAAESGSAIDLLLVDARLGTACDGSRESGVELIRRLAAGNRLPAHVIVMLSTMDRGRLAQQCRELGNFAYLVRPVSSADLLEAVVDALGLGSPHEDTAPLSEPLLAAAPRKVLLAEDTPANQKLFRALLARHGCDVVVVDNGLEAVQRWQAEPFDLVLMDLQMPLMDGLKATAIIRSRERAQGTRVPIIALTAHALPRDRERCLAAGMDDYLSKPIDIHQLEAAIQRVSGAPPAAPQPRPPSTSTPALASGEPLFNRQHALKRLGGNEALFADLVQFFFEDAPSLLQRVRQGIEAGKIDDVRVAAHSLRGLAANFDGLPAMRAAQRVEDLAFDARLQELAAAAETLTQEVQHLCDALREHLPAPPSAPSGP